VAGLYSVDPSFPLHLWDTLLPQAEITLNLLRTSRLHPQLSAGAHFHGRVDYNKTAFAPPGCKIIAHEKSGKRRTWAPHGQHGYSLGPAMHHYRCQNVYISATASERIVDTLEFFPHNYQMPQLSSTDRLLMAAKDMTNALQNHHPEVPFTRVGDDTISALTELAAIFKLKLRQTPSHAPQAAPPTVFQHPSLAESSNQILNSPMPIARQTRSQTIIHTQDIPNVPLPPRVVTPRTLRPSPPRVLPGTLSPQLVSGQLLRNGHSPHGYCPRRQPLVTTAPRKRRHLPSHQKRNGTLGSHEGSPSPTTLDARIWQRMRMPLPRNSRHSRNRFFIKLTNIPKDRKITYGKIVCDYKPHKKEKERVRITVGGDILDYAGDVATSIAYITTFKILINSTLSTEDAAMMMMDIKNYYLGTPLSRFEYMNMLLSRFHEEIIQKYNLKAQAVDGWVYIEIRKGMYGLKQAGLLANQLLKTQLAPFEYYPARLNPGLWLHKTRKISFTLVVDDFAVKYVGKQHAEHLRNALLRTYELTTDWTATVYSGMTFKWDYKNRTCDISMP
jgi:hypothetical protein